MLAVGSGLMKMPVTVAITTLMIGATLALFSRQARADETVGTFSVDSVVLRPTYFSQEEQGGQFSLGDSEIGVLWRKNRHWSAHFDLGDTAYRNLPIYYNNGVNETQFGLVDGYAEYDGIYGRVRAGLIPIDFGYEGVLDDAHRYFLYSQSIANRLVALRDEGVSFYTEHNGYFTELTVHNGSVDQSNGGDPWVTGDWGWSDSRTIRTMLSLQTGLVPAGLTTNDTAIDVANFQPGVTARVRNGAAFVEYTPLYWDVVAEIGGGEIVQNNKTGRYDYDLLQTIHDFSRNLAVGARYDYYDSDMGISGQAQTEFTALLMLKSDDASSNLIIEGTKHIYETNQIHDDQLRVEWLLTPFAH